MAARDTEPSAEGVEVSTGASSSGLPPPDAGTDAAVDADYAQMSADHAQMAATLQSYCEYLGTRETAGGLAGMGHRMLREAGVDGDSAAGDGDETRPAAVFDLERAESALAVFRLLQRGIADSAPAASTQHSALAQEYLGERCHGTRPGLSLPGLR